MGIISLLPREIKYFSPKPFFDEKFFTMKLLYVIIGHNEINMRMIQLIMFNTAARNWRSYEGLMQ